MQELNLEFLKTWKNINELELEGIKTLKKGIKVIFENISKNEIISIYLKGSFLRREMNSKSDVDVVIIVKEKSTLVKINQLQKNYGNSKELNFGFSGYTIDELKTGKLIKFNNNPRSGTPRFVRLLPTYQLIYGEKLNTNNFYQKTEKELFESLIKAFENIFLPKYKTEEINFAMIIKQSLWLFELEVAINNEDYKFTTWNNLPNYLEKTHLVNQTLKYRNIKSTKEEKEKYILKLKKHLEKLNIKLNF